MLCHPRIRVLLNTRDITSREFQSCVVKTSAGTPSATTISRCPRDRYHRRLIVALSPISPAENNMQHSAPTSLFKCTLCRCKQEEHVNSFWDLSAGDVVRILYMYTRAEIARAVFVPQEKLAESRDRKNDMQIKSLQESKHQYALAFLFFLFFLSENWNN